MNDMKYTAYVSVDSIGYNATIEDANAFADYLQRRLPDVCVIVGEGYTDSEIQSDVNDVWDDWCSS